LEYCVTIFGPIPTLVPAILIAAKGLTSNNRRKLICTTKCDVIGDERSRRDGLDHWMATAGDNQCIIVSDRRSDISSKSRDLCETNERI
jgi:hypothetical protein